MSRALFLVCCALLGLGRAADYVLGIDTAYNYTQAQWDCLRGKGYEFAVIRCYRSLGSVDPNCAETVLKARAAGFKRIDLYAFPCYKCGDPAGQMKALRAHVDAKNISYTYLWLDIEMRDPYWDKDLAKNRAFFTAMGNAAQTLFGKQMGGVYTNENGWKGIMGSWSGGSQFRLWWPHWDSAGASWDNFAPFCGWTREHLTFKQFTGTHPTCNMDIDQDSYPVN